MQLAKVMDTLAGRGTGSLVLGGQKYMVIGADPGDIGAAVRGKKGGGPRRSQCTSLPTGAHRQCHSTLLYL